jgi:hypothetical protein
MCTEYPRIGALTFLLSALVIASFCSEATAFETVISEAPCRLAGFARPLRQTVVIIDEDAVETPTGGKPSEVNRRVNRAVLSMAGVLDGQTGMLSAPRERVTVLMARQDGSDLVRVFSGCPPLYSQDEIAQIEKDSSSATGQLWKFIGRDARSQIEKDRNAFQSSLLQAIVEATKLKSQKPAANEDREGLAFLRAIGLARGAFDLGEGVPRILIISPMRPPIINDITDVKTAREKGFQAAAKVGADLQRAEMYITGLSAGSRFARDFAHSFFLGSKGQVIAASGETLPAFLDPARSVHVFGGFIDYVGVKVPMQLRLAIDRSGSLVNSWVEVSVLRPVATPLSGKAVCKGADLISCEVQGDGKGFGQSWVADVKAEPTFDEKLPFSGVRHIEFSTSADGLKGRAFDPNVVFTGSKGLNFELARTVNVKF